MSEDDSTDDESDSGAIPFTASEEFPTSIEDMEEMIDQSAASLLEADLDEEDVQEIESVIEMVTNSMDVLYSVDEHATVLKLCHDLGQIQGEWIIREQQEAYTGPTMKLIDDITTAVWQLQQSVVRGDYEGAVVWPDPNDEDDERTR